MKYETWLLRHISFTIPYHNQWYLTYNCSGPFPVQPIIIRIIEIWHLAANGNSHYNSLSRSLKYDLWLLWVVSFKVPYQINEVWDLAAKGDCFYNSLSKSLKYDRCLFWAISYTVPGHMYWNMTPGCYGQFPLQFRIKSIEMWPMAAMANFLYNSLSN